MMEQNAWQSSDIFDRIKRSKFRSRFKLAADDIKYVKDKGMKTIESHARDFIDKRIVPANIPNDGKQTPMKGHPVFKAMHATACCCRGCLFKWHGIKPGYELTKDEQEYVLDILMEWVKRNTKE